MDAANRSDESKDNLPLSPAVVHMYRFVTSLYVREQRVSHVYHPRILVKVLGIQSNVITSNAVNGRSTYSISARLSIRLPFGLSQAVVGQWRFRNFMPSLPNLILTPQNIIPCESEIIQACSRCEITRIRDILEARQVHPNDRTEDGLTVFRVRMHQCRAYILLMKKPEARDTYRESADC